jgi:hypothetical protein
MIYDVRYETGDVIHRVFKFLQLLILGRNPDNTRSDLKLGSQRLQEDLTRIMAFQMITNLRKVQQTNLNVKPGILHSVE